MKEVDIKGKSILELGCLEGLHTLMLHLLGAKMIVAIEGREDNFIKSLMVKNAFHLDRSTVMFGDIEEILFILPASFDICIALGVLYHLENPIETVYRIGELVGTLFIWTHYSVDSYPAGEMVDVRFNNVVYRGKFVSEDTNHYLSGIKKKSFWVFRDDVFRLLRDAGFMNIKLIKEEKYKGKPAMIILARK